jgi:large subunit ribosomal protein L15
MRLNTLSPAEGEKRLRKRVGRGIGSGFGKTCGRGHKGQKSRSGGFTKIGFEGGQMPLQRRLPKFGFSSRISRITDEVTLGEINKLNEEVITVEVLKQHGLVSKNISRVKVILSGNIERKVVLDGLKATRGALEAINNAGGEVKASAE